MCVYVCVFCQHFQISGPIEAKFHVKPPLDGGTKVYSNGTGQMTKMAAMPIYGKNLKKSSSAEPKADDLENWYAASAARLLPILRQGQVCSLMLPYGKKVKQWIFQKLLSSVI